MRVERENKPAFTRVYIIRQLINCTQRRAIDCVVLLSLMLSSVLSSGRPNLTTPKLSTYSSFDTASHYFYLPIDDEPHIDQEASTSTISYSCTRSLLWDGSEGSCTDQDDSPTRPSSPTASRSRHRPQQEIADILEQKDLYNILGLSRAAASDKMELRRAYLSRSRACHPEYAP